MEKNASRKGAVQVDASEAIKMFKEQGVDIPKWLPKAVRNTANNSTKYMKKQVPVVTGTLKNSIYFEQPFVQGQPVASAQIITSAEYARYVNNGTKPHTIRPVNAKALAFPPSGMRSGTRGSWKEGGVLMGGHKTGLFTTASGKTLDVGLVFAQVVHHPGTKGKHFVEDTADYARKDLLNELKKALNRGK